MATEIGRTSCGLFKLSRGYQGNYTVSRLRAKKLIGQVLIVWSERSYIPGYGLCLGIEKIDGFRVKIFDRHVEIGCQSFTRDDLKEICRHYGWHGY